MNQRSFACSVLWIGLLLVSASAASAASSQTDVVGPEKGGCVCGTTVSGNGICFEGRTCDIVSACNTDADCPGGEVCAIQTCCPPPKDKSCVLPCPDGADCGNPGVCETYELCEPPLYVSLASFDARVEGNGVQLIWTTSTEIDNVGFRVMRARRDGGAVQKDGRLEVEETALSLEMVTPELVLAAGSPVEGASYKYLDAGKQRPGQVYYYLQDIDVFGKATLHGPVVVTIPAPRKVEVGSKH